MFSELTSLISIGTVFHSFGAYLTKAASPIFLRLLLGTSNKPALDDRSVLEGKYLTRDFAMYLGPSPLGALYIRRRTLKSILNVTESQCRAVKTGLMCSLLGSG